MLEGKKNGFTLLEVLVSATILAVLAVIGVVSFGPVNKRSRDVKRKGDLEQIRSALEMYRGDNGIYPDVNDGDWGSAQSLASGPNALVSTYAPAIPDDPVTTKHYYYQATNQFPGPYYGYCVCACLESKNCDGTDPANIILNTCIAAPTTSTCNYYLKNP